MTLVSSAAATEGYPAGDLYTPILQWGSEGSGNGQFVSPSGIALDGSGNVYVTDRGNNRLQVFTGTGEFVRAWGVEGTGNGEFRGPRGVVVDRDNFVYVVDNRNNRIQKFTSTGSYTGAHCYDAQFHPGGADGLNVGKLTLPRSNCNLQLDMFAAL